MFNIHIDLKAFTCFFFVYILVWNGSFAQVKSWQDIPLPYIYGNSYGGSFGVPFQSDDSIFFSVPTSQSRDRLVKFDGEFTKVLTDINTPLKIKGGYSKNFGNLYFIDGFGGNRLAYFDPLADTVKWFQNFDQSGGYLPKTFEYQGFTYYYYQTQSGKLDIVKLTSTGPVIVPYPQSFSISDYCYVDENYVLFTGISANGSYGSQVLKYDGNQFIEIVSNNYRFSADRTIVKLKGKYYTTSDNNDADTRIVEIADTGFNIIENLPIDDYIYSNLFVWNNKIWFSYVEEGPGTTTYTHIASFNGDSLKVEALNCGKRMVNAVVYQNQLYFSATLNNYLYTTFNSFRYDTLEQIHLPLNIGDSAWWTSFDYFFEHKGLLYTNITKIGSSEIPVSYSFDGNNFANIPASEIGKSNTVFPGITIKDKLAAYSSVVGVPSQYPYNFAYLTDTIVRTACQGGSFSIGTQEEGSVFQWQMHDGTQFINLSNNTIFSNTNTHELSIQKPPTSYAKYAFRCLVDGQASVIYKLKFQNIFIGANAFDRSWENPLYWTCATVPDENTDAYIYSGRVVINSSTTVGSLRTGSDATVKVSPGVSLIIKK